MKTPKRTRTAAKKIPRQEQVFHGSLDGRLAEIEARVVTQELSIETLRAIVRVLVLERNARHDAHYPTSAKSSRKA